MISIKPTSQTLLQLDVRNNLGTMLTALSFAALLCGCQGIGPGVSQPVSPAELTGKVYGGQQPIAGASIVVYQVGTSSDGSPSASIMTKSVSTLQNGGFSLAGAISCPAASTQVYLLATGGNPGLNGTVNNTAISLMTALGSCGSLNSTTTISVNELTTVASVAALLPFMKSATSIGSGTSDAAQLSAAMALVNQYVNTSNGSVPGPALPNGYSASTLALTSLADASASCVNSAGGTAGDKSPCGNLFADTAYPGSNVPTEVVGALIDELTVPTNNVSPVFGLIGTTPAYPNGLAQAPTTWALPISTSTSGTVQFQNATYGVTEGAASVTLTLTRSASAGSASVNYTTVDGTATSATDYQSTVGIVSWSDGDATAKAVTVPLYNPGIASGTRTFSVSLNTPQGGVSLGTNAAASVAISEADSPISINTTSLSSANQYASYSGTLSGSGGVGSLGWTLATGSSLPAGLTLSSTGTLSGTPTVSGSFNFTVQATDQATPTNQSAQQALSLNIVSLAQQVANLPTDTSANAIKKAVLTWGIKGAASLATNGDATGSANLTSDVVNQLGATFIVPSTLPAQYFPAIPSISTNPGVTAANKNIANILSADTSSPPVWDDTSYTDVTAGTNLQNAEDMLTALLTPGQTYYLNPSLVPSILSRMESASYDIANSFPADFQCAAELPYLYLMLNQAFPQLMLPSRQAVWKQIVANNNAVEITNNGTYFTNYSSNAANWWINADVRNLTAIVYGDLVGGTSSQHTAIVQGGLAEMQAALQQDGGTNYTDTQNEVFSYHDVYVTELARYTQVTGDTLGSQLAAATRYYTPLSLVPPAVGEYVTASAWHKYWNTNTLNNGMEVVVGLTGDQASLAQLQSVGYPTRYFSASFYRSDVTPSPLPTNWITYDRNSQGPRGIQGNFEYIGTTRLTPYSKRGKATFVGSVLENSTTSGGGWTLNSAVESAGTVVLKAAGAELVGASNGGYSANLVNEAQSEHNAATTTATYGAVSTVHTISGYEATATSWVETEGWVLLPTRVIGLVSVQNTASEKAFELDGGLKLVSGRSNWGTQKTFTQLSSNLWTYGNTTVQVYANDYASSRTELTGTWEDTANKAGWILLTDAHNSSTTAYTFPAGTSHYFLADFRPSTSAAATSVQKLSLAAGLAGFSFVDGGVTYTLVQNTTASAIAYAAPNGATVVPSGAQYRASWIDPNGTTAVAPATYTGTIPAYAHIVITQ